MIKINRTWYLVQLQLVVVVEVHSDTSLHYSFNQFRRKSNLLYILQPGTRGTRQYYCVWS